MLQRLFDQLARPWTPITAALLGMMLTLPALGTGLIIDDYFQRAILQGSGSIGKGARPLWDLFAFIPNGPRRAAILPTGLLTWWADPQITLAFLRPLTALSHMLDYALWPDNFPLQHLQSVLWYGLAIFVVARFYRRLHGATAVAGLAALFFAVDDAHSMSVGWLANRHVLIALVLAVLTLEAHRHWRSSGSSAWAAAASLLFAAALSCSEAGLATVGYLAAWQLTMDTSPRHHRLAALLPYAVLLVAWRLLYEHLGYGTTGSGLYIDPAHRPVEFAVALADRWPILQLAQWFKIPSDLFVVLPRVGQIALTVLGIAACIQLLRWLLPLLRARREARFWAVGLSLALVPFCAGFPMDRLLPFSGVGVAALLAMLFNREGRVDAPTPAAGTRLATVMIVLHAPLAALLLVVRVVALPVFNAPIEAIVATAPVDSATPHQTMVFVNAVELVGYLPIVQALETPALTTRRVAVLTSMFSDNHVARESGDTLVITAARGFIRTTVEQLLRRPDQPFTVGEQIERADFTAEIRRITEDGRPQQVAFRFHAPLESPEYRWFAWTEAGGGPFHLPAVGASAELPATGTLAVGRTQSR